MVAIYGVHEGGERKTQFLTNLIKQKINKIIFLFQVNSCIVASMKLVHLLSRLSLCFVFFFSFDAVATKCKVTDTFSLQAPQIIPSTQVLWIGDQTLQQYDPTAGISSISHAYVSSIWPKKSAKPQSSLFDFVNPSEFKSKLEALKEKEGTLDPIRSARYWFTHQKENFQNLIVILFVNELDPETFQEQILDLQKLTLGRAEKIHFYLSVPRDEVKGLGKLTETPKDAPETNGLETKPTTVYETENNLKETYAQIENYIERNAIVPQVFELSGHPRNNKIEVTDLQQVILDSHFDAETQKLQVIADASTVQGTEIQVQYHLDGCHSDFLSASNFSVGVMRKKASYIQGTTQVHGVDYPDRVSGIGQAISLYYLPPMLIGEGTAASVGYFSRVTIGRGFPRQDGTGAKLKTLSTPEISEALGFYIHSDTGRATSVKFAVYGYSRQWLRRSSPYDITTRVYWGGGLEFNLEFKNVGKKVHPYVGLGGSMIARETADDPYGYIGAGSEFFVTIGLRPKWKWN